MHPALTDPRINAPRWPFFRLLAIAGIVLAVVTSLSRLGRTLSEDGLEVVAYSVAGTIAIMFAVLLAATSLAVRRLRALESPLAPAGEHRMLFPTFGFGTTGMRLLAIDGGETSPRGLWGWKLVEITPYGVHVHSHPELPEETRSFAASEIVDAAPGAITDGMLRIPTLNLAIETSGGTVGLPLGLMRHPLAVMSVQEQADTVARVRHLLGVPRA